MILRFVPRNLHMVMDYVEAVALVFASMIFGFSDVGGAAVAVPILVGAVLFIYSLFTKYEGGVFKVMSVPYHFIFDGMLGVFLLISPFFFGFINSGLNSWLPHVVVGLVMIGQAVFSKVSSYHAIKHAM